MKTIILTMALGMLVACQSKQNVEDFNANSDSMMTEVDLAKPKLESIEFLAPQEKMEETEPEGVPAIPPPPAPIGKPASKSNHQKPVERQIIKNARLSFQVNNLNASSKRIEQIVKNFDGIIVLSEETHQDNELRQSLDVRVPAIKLDSFLVLLLKESIYTERKSISVEDVTKQYVDLNARIRSKLVTENKYLELLKKAQNIKDVLTIEEQLSTMREEIEVKQSELIALKNDVAMSTIWDRVKGDFIRLAIRKGQRIPRCIPFLPAPFSMFSRISHWICSWGFNLDFPRRPPNTIPLWMGLKRNCKFPRPRQRLAESPTTAHFSIFLHRHATCERSTTACAISSR